MIYFILNLGVSLQELSQFPEMTFQLAALAAFDEINLQAVRLINLFLFPESVAVKRHMIVATDFKKKIVGRQIEIGTKLPSTQKH